MIIDVHHVFSWGRHLFFPLSEDSKLVLKLMDRNSYTKKHLKEIWEHGWKVRVDGIICAESFFNEKF